MKKYQVIFSKDANKEELRSKLIAWLGNGWELSPSNFEYLFIFGGDGTFVHHVSNYVDQQVKIIGINIGNIGFYYDLDKQDLKKPLIINEKNFHQPYYLSLKANDKTIINALNDIVFQSLNTISIDISICNELLESFKGSGLLFSSPTGSTGYNHSLKGSILPFDSNLYNVVEIAPLGNKKNRTLGHCITLDGNYSTKLDHFHSDQLMQIIADGVVINYEIKKDSQFTIKLKQAKCKIYFANDLKSLIKKLRRVFI